MATTKKSSMAYCPPDWQIESDLRTLQEAEAIRKDPKRFKKAQELAKTKLMELAKVAGGDAD